MTTNQYLISAILLATLFLFIWGRWRYDIVAMLANLPLPHYPYPFEQHP